MLLTFGKLFKVIGRRMVVPCQRMHYSISKGDIPTLAKSIIAGDRQALSRSITLLESKLPEHQKLANHLMQELSHTNNDSLKPKATTIRLGFSGAPGVGKSTLIETFGMYLVRDQRKRLAVLTVDPSSIRSGGSILGDKTRMPSLSQHPNAYIRSSPNQGDTGGVILSTFDTIKISAHFNVILVETVGVGQSELAVADLVDIFVLLVAPGVGDELQGLKKGITEIADVILVNKADDPLDKGANQTLFEYQSAMKFALGGGPPKKVLPISGKTGRGIPEAWKAIQERFLATETATIGKRKQQETKWVINMAQQRVLERFDFV